MIAIEITTEKVIAKLPYDREFISGAKLIGGKWNPTAKAWEFATTEEQAVRDLAKSVFGTDGSCTETVSIRYDLSKHADKGEVKLGGRLLASRHYRDAAVRLGEDVVLISGEFKDEERGSMRYPKIGINTAVIEVRKFPKDVAEAEGLEIVGEAEIDVDALKVEKENLLARLAEIDALLGE